jgi:hypothetical protein
MSFFLANQRFIKRTGGTKESNSNGMNRMTKTERNEQEYCEQVL